MVDFCEYTGSKCFLSTNTTGIYENGNNTIVNSLEIHALNTSVYLRNDLMAYASTLFNKVPYFSSNNFLRIFKGTGNIFLNGSRNFYLSLDIDESGIFVRKDFFACAFGNLSVSSSDKIFDKLHCNDKNGKTRSSVAGDDAYDILSKYYVYVKGSGCVILKVPFNTDLLHKNKIESKCSIIANIRNIIVLQDSFDLRVFTAINNKSIFKICGIGILIINNLNIT